MFNLSNLRICGQYGQLISKPLALAFGPINLLAVGAEVGYPRTIFFVGTRCRLAELFDWMIATQAG
jgi:hypothetical protein